MATVHLYLHPSTVETKYIGIMSVELFNDSGAEPHESKVDLTVTPGGPPVNHSMTGRVTTKPGVYAVRISLLATSSATKGLEIRENVSVTVK